MSAYSFIIDKELRGDGANLSSTLYSVCEEQRRKGEILKFIRSLPEQDIVDIRFVKTERNEVLVQLVESFAGHERLRDASVLSDGTLRILAVAAALLSGPEGSLVIIEEIDNGVHPSRAEMLLRNIQDVAQQRNLRVLLTSHNPALLDTLPLAAIPHVVCCYRDPEEGDSRLIRLQDLRSYPELVARGPLGQLMTKGILDKYLKNQRTAEEQKDQSQDWLNELRLQVAES